MEVAGRDSKGKGQQPGQRVPGSANSKCEGPAAGPGSRGVGPGAGWKCPLLARAPQLGLLEVEIVLLLFPGLEVLGLLLPLQHLQLLLTHGLLSLSLQPQLLHLGAQEEDRMKEDSWTTRVPWSRGWDYNPGLAAARQSWTQDWSRAA